MATEGIRLRLQRATEIFDTLGEEINAIDLNEFGTVEGTFDERKEATVFTFRKHGELPRRLSLLFGEYVYHLRSSLDNLVTRRATPKGDNNSFPMYRELHTWVSKVENPRKARSSPLFGLTGQEVALIKKLQPFNAGDLSAAKSTHLAVQNRLSNKDKHDAMHACFAVVPQLGEQLYLTSTPENLRIDRLSQAEPGTPLKDGTCMAVTKLYTEPELVEQIEVHPAFPIGISFSDDEGEVVGLPKVRELWFAVAQIIVAWDKAVQEIQQPADRAWTIPTPPA